jgi:Protein of unknown function (DUF2911)
MMENKYFNMFWTFALCLISFIGTAQTDKATRPSPLMEANGIIHGATIKVTYSSPSVKGRVVWGDLVPYGKVWRTGANEATIFETDKDIKINGEKLAAGKYGLFTIPGENEWTFIFNTVWDQWGAFKYDQAKDVLRVKVKADKSSTFNEKMTFEIKDKMIVLSWENLTVGVDVK